MAVAPNPCIVQDLGLAHYVNGATLDVLNGPCRRIIVRERKSVCV